jgi:tetratricopeptide (TPR) repeat protein
VDWQRLENCRARDRPSAGEFSVNKAPTFLFSLAGVLFFGWAAFEAIRLAVAETAFREDTPQAVKRAVAIQGGTPSAEFEEHLAELDVADARGSLERAVAMNSRSSGAWMSLGILEDSAGDPASAERFLLKAARVDRQYLPAWTLTNFYFRRGNRELFWEWANRAAALTYDEFPPLLSLCDQFEPDPARMLAHLGDVRRLRPPYLAFLISENRLDAAQQVARAMSEDRANDPYLINLADRQLGAGNIDAAIELWNVASGLGPIGPSSGSILTNGNLARVPLNLGFDWRLGQAEGVASNWRPSELIFNLSGSQPETCVLLEQTICLVPGHFRLRFDYMTRDAPSAGIRWSLDKVEGPVLEPSERWREGEFAVPRTRGLAHLKLFYRREPGTTRAEGRIEIRNVRLEAS